MYTTLFASLLILIQQPGPPPPPVPVLVVSGNASVMAVPDQAIVRLGIVRQAASAQAAQEQANVAAREILNAVEKAGVPPNQIQTARLVLTPIYAPRNPDSRDAPRIVAYNATNTISVRLENLSIVGTVIDAGLRAGSNQIEGVGFALRNDLPSRQQALKQAVEEARSKAQTMAEALRVNLLEVLEVSEGGVSIVDRVEPVFASRAAAVAETPVSPGQIEVRASVTIRYRISAKQ